MNKKHIVGSLRIVTAFVIGLLSGFLVIRFFYQTNWWFYLLMLVSPFIGGIGMLSVGPHSQHPAFTGRITAWPAWLGFWLAFLIWEAFHPHMIFITLSGCFAAGCDPGVLNSPENIPIPFPLVFIIFFICCGFGLVLIEVGMQLMLKYLCRRGIQSGASVLKTLSAEDARRQLLLRRAQDGYSRNRRIPTRSRFRR